MVTYKAVNEGSLNADLTTVADAIRKRGFTEGDLEFPSGFVSAVETMPDYLAAYLKKELAEYTSTELSGQLPSSLFAGRTDIVRVTLPNWTGGASYAFNGCSNLSNVSCPSLAAIGEGCFLNCKSLTSIKMPSLTYIGYGAFKGCDNLETVVIGTADSTNVVTLSSEAFANTKITATTGSIYVPDGKVSSYKGAANWSTYASQIKALSEYTGN